MRVVWGRLGRERTEQPGPWGSGVVADEEVFGGLHVLVNNAGGLWLKRQATVDGLEMTFAVNHLAYFLLTHSFLETLKSSAPAR